jgi:hypothetical protein
MKYFANAVFRESYVESPAREPRAAPPEVTGFISPLRWFLTYFADAISFTATEALRVDSWRGTTDWDVVRPPSYLVLWAMSDGDPEL